MERPPLPGGDQPRLRQALEALGAVVDLMGRREPFAAEPATARVARDLQAPEGATAPPRGPALEEVRQRILAALAARDGVAALTRRDLRSAPWLLWGAPKPLADSRPLVDAILRQAGRDRATRRNLIEAWLAGFDMRAPRIQETGEQITEQVASSDDGRLELWRTAHREFRLFDPDVGPARVADRIVGDPRPVPEILARAGIDDPLRQVSGYARAVQAELLKRVPTVLREPRSAAKRERITAFLAPDGQLRFDDGASKGLLAKASLAAWLDRGAAPSADAQAAVQRFLLAHLGDPRLRKAAWHEAGESATGLMRQWLGRASFRAFFGLIDEMSSDQQWRYRQAFWSAYVDRGYVNDIWLALGKNLSASARAVRELAGGYAELSGTPKQAVLLFRVGDLVLCEWSNVGKLRAWPRSERSAPQPYLPAYASTDLRSPSLAFEAGFGQRLYRENGLSHDSPGKGGWQSKAAAFLSRSGGVPLLGPADWMPRR